MSLCRSERSSSRDPPHSLMNVIFSPFARVTGSSVAPCDRVFDLVPTGTKKGPRPLRRSNARSRKARLWRD